MYLNMKRHFLIGIMVSAVFLSGCKEKSFSVMDGDGNELNTYFECQKLCDTDNILPLSYSKGYTAVLEPKSPNDCHSVMVNGDGSILNADSVIKDKNAVISKMFYDGSYTYILYYTRNDVVKRYIVKADLEKNEIKNIYNVPAGRSILDFCVSSDGQIYYIYAHMISDSEMNTDITILDSDMNIKKEVILGDLIGGINDDLYADNCFFSGNQLYVSTYRMNEEESYPDALYRINPECTVYEDTELVTSEFGNWISVCFESDSGKIILGGMDETTGNLLLSRYTDSSFKNVDKRYDIPDVKGVCKGSGEYDLYYVDDDGIKGFNFDDEKSTVLCELDKKITSFSGFSACGTVNDNDVVISYLAPNDSVQLVSLYNSELKKNKTYSLQDGKICDALDLIVSDEKFLYISGYDNDNNPYVEIWDNESNLISSILISEKNVELSDYYNIDIVGINDSTIYVALENDNECYVYVMNDEGSVCTYQHTGYISSFSNTKDSYIICEENNEIYCVNLRNNEETIINNLELSDNIKIFNGDQECDFYYSSTDGIYQYDLNTQSSKCLLNMLGSDIYFHVYDWFQENNNSYIIRAYDGVTGESGFYRLIRSGKNIYDIRKNKKQINVAVLGQMSDGIASEMLSFNRENSEYQIVLEDYSKYNNDNTSIEKFNMDIMSGKIPDIIIGDNKSRFDDYIKRNIFVDVSSFISQMDNNQYYNKIMNTFHKDDEIYAVVSEFSFNSYTGDAKFINKSDNYTNDDFEKDMDLILSEGEDGIKRDELINLMILNNLSSYIDTEKGICNFNSLEFIRILDDIKKYCCSEEHDEFTEHNNSAMFSKFSSLKQCSYVNNIIYKNNGVFLGGPVENSDEWSFSFVPERVFGISTNCTCNEIAWKFIEQFIKTENQEKAEHFPVNKNAMNTMFEKCMYDENQTWGSYRIPVMDNKFADKLSKMFDELYIKTYNDDVVYNIIIDEINEMVAYDTDTKEIAEKIQNSVCKYYNEVK